METKHSGLSGRVEARLFMPESDYALTIHFSRGGRTAFIVDNAMTSDTVALVQFRNLKYMSMEDWFKDEDAILSVLKGGVDVK
jgi:hypothetical protein